MNLLIRLVVAVLVAFIVSGVLNWLGLFNANINGLLAILAGIVTFLSWDGSTRR